MRSMRAGWGNISIKSIRRWLGSSARCEFFVVQTVEAQERKGEKRCPGTPDRMRRGKKHKKWELRFLCPPRQEGVAY